MNKSFKATETSPYPLTITFLLSYRPFSTELSLPVSRYFRGYLLPVQAMKAS